MFRSDYTKLYNQNISNNVLTLHIDNLNQIFKSNHYLEDAIQTLIIYIYALADFILTLKN